MFRQLIVIVTTLIFAPAFIGCQGKLNVKKPSAENQVDEVAPPTASAAKLLATGCVDPDLGKLASSERMMLCDGTFAAGQLDLSVLSAENIKAGTTIAGVVGTVVPTDVASCTSDGQKNCIANDTYPVVDLSQLTAGNIKKDVIIAGVTGNYPSITFPLPGSASGVSKLRLDNFNSSLQSSSEFEWWDASGNHYRRSGVGGDLVAANIKKDASILGVSGSFEGTAAGDCAADGEVGCLSTDRFKVVDTESISAFDIRRGVTVGGVSGQLAFFRNLVGGFNRVAADGDGSHAGPDAFDTVEDYNNISATDPYIPTTVPLASDGGAALAGWYGHAESTWLRDPLSDTDENGECNGDEDCVYIDQITKMTWSRGTSSMINWEDHISYCHALNGSSYGGYSTGWRLPTQKELMQAYINRIWAMKDPDQLNLVGGSYASATTMSNSVTYFWSVRLATGIVGQSLKTDELTRTVCVR